MLVTQLLREGRQGTCIARLATTYLRVALLVRGHLTLTAKLGVHATLALRSGQFYGSCLVP